jgi:hypothetical protein
LQEPEDVLQRHLEASNFGKTKKPRLGNLVQSIDPDISAEHAYVELQTSFYTNHPSMVNHIADIVLDVEPYFRREERGRWNCYGLYNTTIHISEEMRYTTTVRMDEERRLGLTFKDLFTLVPRYKSDPRLNDA